MYDVFRSWKSCFCVFLAYSVSQELLHTILQRTTSFNNWYSNNRIYSIPINKNIHLNYCQFSRTIQSLQSWKVPTLHISFLFFLQSTRYVHDMWALHYHYTHILFILLQIEYRKREREVKDRNETNSINNKMTKKKHFPYHSWELATHKTIK